MSGLMTALFQPLKLIKQTVGSISNVACSTALVKSEYPLLTTIRTKVRCYFPRPNEVRRVRRHGWKTRMSTPAGRRVIMRRLLKGRFILFYVLYIAPYILAHGFLQK